MLLSMSHSKQPFILPDNSSVPYPKFFGGLLLFGRVIGVFLCRHYGWLLGKKLALNQLQSGVAYLYPLKMLENLKGFW